MTITTQSPCSTFPSGNYSSGLQIFLTIKENRFEFGYILVEILQILSMCSFFCVKKTRV